MYLTCLFIEREVAYLGMSMTSKVSIFTCLKNPKLNARLRKPLVWYKPKQVCYGVRIGGTGAASLLF